MEPTAAVALDRVSERRQEKFKEPQAARSVIFRPVVPRER